MDLVGHYFHIERIARIGIDGLRSVAHDAQRKATARPAVKRQLIMASIATRVADHIARSYNRRAVGHEVERRAGVVGAEIEHRQIAAAVYADGMGGRGIV